MRYSYGSESPHGLAATCADSISLKIAQNMCGGWDLNPRRPTPADLESAPFDPLGHPRHIYNRDYWDFRFFSIFTMYVISGCPGASCLFGIEVYSIFEPSR